MIKINSNTYIEFFKEFPDMQMELSGWNAKVVYYLCMFLPVVIYTKQFIK